MNMIDDLSSDLGEEKSINAFTVYKIRIDKNEQIRQHVQVKTADESREEKNWRELLVLNGKYGEYRPRFENNMSKYASM